MNEQFFFNLNVRFNLRQPRSKKPTIIYAIIHFDKKQYKISIGAKVYSHHWDKVRQLAHLGNGLTRLDNHNNNIANNKIKETLFCIERLKLYLCESPEVLNEKNLYFTLKRFINPMMKIKKMEKTKENATITIKKLINRQSIKESSKIVKNGHISKFERFLTEQKILNTWENMNLSTLERYQQYLIEKGQAQDTIKNSTAGVKSALSLVKRHKEIPFDYQNSGIDDFQPLKSKLSKAVKKDKQKALTEDDLKRLYEFPLTGRDEEVRDVFLLQCLVGQRIADIPKLLNGDFTMDADSKTITIIQGKNSEEATIPLSDIAQEIINKYKVGFSYLNFSQTRPDNRLNEYIKEVARKVGFTDMVKYNTQRGIGIETIEEPMYKRFHTHMARHTFITIMCRGGVEKETIIIATGHRDTKMIDEVYSHLSTEDKRAKISQAVNGLNSPLFGSKSIKKKEVAPIPEIDVKAIVNQTIQATLQEMGIKKDTTEITSSIKESDLKQAELERAAKMITSLIQDGVPDELIINMLENGDFLQSYSSGAMTSGYFIKKHPKKER